MSGSKGGAGGVGLVIAVAVLMLLSCGASAGQGDVPSCSPAVGRVVSRQGSVEIRRAGLADWFRVERLDTPICDGDAVRTGPRSRAALWLQPENLIRLDQKTAVTLVATKTETRVEFFSNGQVSADPDCGAAYFISRFPRNFKVRTPFIAAAIKGTEFLVNSLCSSTTLAVFEGAVAAQDLLTRREIQVDALQQISVGPGLPSSIPIPIKPRDGVQWTIYYPRMPSTHPVDGQDAFLESCPADSDRVACDVRDIEALLAAGATEDAQQQIERLHALGHEEAPLLAIEAVLRIRTNDRDGAALLSEKAIQKDPGSSLAWAAMSYVRQAKRDLPGALDAARRVSAIEPGPWSLARESELLLGLGRGREAAAAAAAAVASNPLEPRAHQVTGFGHLAVHRSDEAAEAFQKSIDLDSQDPVSWMGLGLARIRQGDLTRGREDLEIAVALDPLNAVARSYLARAFFDEKSVPRLGVALEQLSLAESQDRFDPLPWYLSAVMKQVSNRPVEAMQDLAQSQKLNANRGVYRGAQLLDRDEVTRLARLAQIYRETGFDQTAISTASEAVGRDASDSSAHRLLADAYFVQPRSELARDSELLQALMLQPVNPYPVQPRLASNGISVADSRSSFALGTNEFTSLIGARPLNLHLEGVIGSLGTLGSNVILSGMQGNTSYSLGTYNFATESFRPNADRRQWIGNLFVQKDFSDQFSLQIEARQLKEKFGDRYIFFLDDQNFSRDYREAVDVVGTRIGMRFTPDIRNTVLLNYTYVTGTDDAYQPSLPYLLNLTESAHFGEARYIYSREALQWNVGAGHQEGADKAYVNDQGRTLNERGASRQSNAYAYATVALTPSLRAEGGLSYDAFDDGLYEKSQTNPKAGVRYALTDETSVRAGYFRTLKRRFLTSQTLEPTAVAGFNQFFDEYNGTDSRGYGVGLDRRAADAKSAINVEVLHRDLRIPPAVIAANDPGDLKWRENIARASFAQALTGNTTLTVGYSLEHFRRDAAASNSEALASSMTHRVPIEIRSFLPNGFFLRLKVTYLNQRGSFANFETLSVDYAKTQFALIDFGVGYRIPGQRGIISLEVRNALDRNFLFQDINPAEPSVAYQRLGLVKAVFWF